MSQVFSVGTGRIVVKFPEVKRCKKRTGTCSCGRRTQRTITVTHTVSPFNVNGSGIQKTTEEVTRDVEAELTAKTSGPLRCTRCEP